jgi:serine/threonine protein kinase
LICSRCGHPDIPEASTVCPNCGFTFKSGSRLTSTTSFRALSARRKMLTSRQYAMPFALGDDAFDDYVIRDLLGQGPLGVVYMTTNNRGDQFALKVFHKRWKVDMDLEGLKGNYLNIEDIEGGQRLNLPVKVLIKDEQVGLLSAHLEGLTVRKLMNLRKNTSKAFRLDELTQLVHGISAPVKFLHRENIAHGGLKPENFFVHADEDQKQVVTLSDSCLSTGLGIETYYKAQRAAGYGHYLAPELSKGTLSLSSDVYSLGVFIFEGITGQVYQTKKSIKEIVPAQGIEPLEELIARALHQDPNQRYRDISALLSAYDDVAKYLDELEGSPFNSEGTHPRNESMVTRFSITDLGKSNNDEDPLFGEKSTEQKLNSPPPLPGSQNGSVSPPPLPMPALSIGAESGTFPINEASPQLDILSQVGQNPGSGPSLDSIVSSDPSLDLLGESPLSVSVGAPKSLPKPVHTHQQSSSNLWLGILITFCIASGVYLLLNQGPSTTKQIVVPIELPVSSTSQTSVSGINTSKVASVQIKEVSEKAGSEKAGSEKAGSEKAGSEKAASEKAALEKAALEKVALEKAASEKAASEKAALEKIALEKIATEKAASEKARREKVRTQKSTPKGASDRSKKKEERARIAAEKKEERARIAAEKKEERARIAAEKKEERARIAAEKKEDRARIAAEKAAKKKADQDRNAAEKLVKKTAERKQAAVDKAAKEKAEREKRIAASNLKTKSAKKKENLVVPKKAQIDDEAKVLKCPAGMILKRTARFPRGSIRRGKIKGKKAIALARSGKVYCIDAYEYPGRGQKPKVNVTFNGAKSLCEQANKRLCSGSEWVRACKGKRGAKYPYGKRFNPSKCVTEDKEGEERRRSTSGSMRSCKSASGAYDMSGNIAEWTSDQRVRGGYYASYDDEATCSSGGRRSPSSKRGYIGLRCCMDFKK